MPSRVEAGMAGWFASAVALLLVLVAAFAASPAGASRAAPETIVVGGAGDEGGDRRAPSSDEVSFATDVLERARVVLAGHGYYSAHPIKLTFLDDQGIVDADDLAYVTSADIPPGNSPTCNMFLTREGRDANENLKRLTLVHEYAHCAQHAFYSSRSEFKTARKWVIEGTADWIAGAAVAEMGQPVDGVEWARWLKKPKLDLFKRSYDAAGFFAMIDQAGVSAWSRIKDVLQAAKNGDGAAYSAATAGLPEIFYARWGPGFVRKPELGPEWDLTGPGIPSSKPTKVKIGNGQKRKTTTDPRAAAAGELDIKAQVFSVRTAKQTRGLLRTSGGSLHKLTTGSYCAIPGGCVCKTGRTAELPTISPGASWVGFGGDPKKARTATFEGFALRDWCRGKGPKPAPGESCSKGGDACPVPPPGIELYDENTNLIATFRSGNCTAGSNFLGVSSDGAWELEVAITNFRGFDQSYPLTFGASDPQVVIDGPGGPYGNQSSAPGPAPAGGIYLHPNGDLGLGMPAALTADGNSGVAVAGVMDCIYPDER